MSKKIKITAAILGILVIAVSVIFIIYPGILTYIMVNIKYDHINDTVIEFPITESPDDYKRFTLDGISVLAPADSYFNRDNKEERIRNSLINNGHTLIHVTKYDAGALNDFDPYVYYDHSKLEFKEFFKAIGEPMPLDTVTMLYFVKDKVTSKTCLKLRGENKEVFKEMAAIKDESTDLEASRILHGNGFTAYISKPLSNPLGLGDRCWTAAIYPDGVTDYYYYAILDANNNELSKQIISSIELA